MDVTLEIHAPGLDMSQARWTHHLIFMQEIHQRLGQIHSLARAQYDAHGRGTLHVSRSQWMEVVRDAITDEDAGELPHSYLSSEQAAARCDFGLLNGGFRGVLERYDPQREFVLTVEHHPQGLLSCYVIDPASGGRELVR